MKQDIKRALSDLYSDASKFNQIAGNDSKLTWADMKFQVKLLQDELDETKEAIENKDTVELLDGAADVAVVLFGLIRKLEILGFNVDHALYRVSDNNLSKFPYSEQTADDSLKEGWTATYNQSYGVWVIKDENGKIRKPTTFKDVKLGDLVAEVKG